MPAFGVQGLWVLLAYATNSPGLLWRERAPPFSRGSAPQARLYFYARSTAATPAGNAHRAC